MQVQAEEVCRALYKEMQAFYAGKEQLLGPAAHGFDILHGPPVVNAPFHRDVELIEPFVSEDLVIFERVACLAVVQGRPRRKVGGQFSAALHDALLLFGDLEIHATGLLTTLGLQVQYPISGVRGYRRKTVVTIAWDTP